MEKYHNYIWFDPTTTKVGDIAVGVIHCWFLYENNSLVENLFKCQWATMVNLINLRN
jgi:hypothetical protein